jgi:hypothetical protein
LQKIHRENLTALQNDFITKLAPLTSAKVQLATRVDELEHKMAINAIHMDLLRRRLDDTEQYTRRPNLIVDGIYVTPRESPSTLRRLMLNEIDKLNIDVDDLDIDRVHRHEDPYIDSNGRKVQPVIIRFTSWYCRNELYAKRFDSRFRYRADLTCRRQQILNYARDKVQTCPNLRDNVVEFVAADRNCKLILRSKSGKVLGFSSEIEFDNQLRALDNHDPRGFMDKFSFDRSILSAPPTSPDAPPTSPGSPPGSPPTSPGSPSKPFGSPSTTTSFADVTSSPR